MLPYDSLLLTTIFLYALLLCAHLEAKLWLGVQAGAAGAQLGAHGSKGYSVAYQPAAYPAALYSAEHTHATSFGIAYGAASQGVAGAGPQAGPYIGTAPMQPGQQAAPLQAAVCQAPSGFPANLALGFKGALDAGSGNTANCAAAGGFHPNVAQVLPDMGLAAGGVYHGQPLTAVVSPALFAEQQYVLAAAYGVPTVAPAAGQSSAAVSEAEFSQLYYRQYFNQP